MFPCALSFGTAQVECIAEPEGKLNGPRSDLTCNSHLLDGIEVPAPVTSFLDLIPDSGDVALCRDSSNPEPVTYQELRAILKDPTIAAFLTRGDRVAVVLQNGREMAMSLLTVMHHACAVPLNPNFTEAELVSSFKQLRCSTVITTSAHLPALAAARQLDLRILLQVGQGSSLKFEGCEDDGSLNPARAQQQDFIDEQHPVLLLKTSGTTSKGKVVPFSMRRLKLY
ncbi:unnamed protein product [Cladocopium goreaui]|uniref:Oxalate--CoA ligase (Oxalyl-CoA synthetase ) (Peroxisomal-coenzyme A synthetase) n=1 Tax=Cladocopium goreaui TaxID=2562237 RepID=A0A9P1DVG3_9DINO|nr:unnamed protein product [Cladocopium goreaui]